MCEDVNFIQLCKYRSSCKWRVSFNTHCNDWGNITATKLLSG